MIHFNNLPKSDSKILMNSFSQKVRCAFIIIGTFISKFSLNEDRSNLNICDHPIITFVKRGLCLVISNTSHVGSLDIFGKIWCYL